MFKLIIEDDEGKTTVVPILRDEITIGRKEGNNIRLTERNVSRHHARIAKNGSQHVSIEDLDSYNGIRVNGDRIQVKTPVSIQEGDLIEIGDYHLAIQLEGTAQPALAGGTPAEESTQRVTMQALAEGTSPGVLPPEEVTAQVMAPQPSEPDLPQAEPDAELPPPAVANEPTMRLAAPPAEPEEVPQRRPEPTAIIRTSDLAPPPAAAASTEHARVVVMSTALAGNTFNLTKDETVIGRTDDNDVILDHRSVSRNHAKIVRDGPRYAVVDLNSANGVLVNGEEYKRIDLRRGDVIELGHVKLRFVEAGETFTIPASELERLRREDPAVDGEVGDTTGSMSTRSVRALPGGGKPFPVRTVAMVLGALVLLGGVAGIASMCGGPSHTQTATPQDPTKAPPPPDKPTTAVSEARVRPTPPPDKPRQPDPTPTPTPTPPKVDDRAAEAAKTMVAARAAMKAGEFVKARELFAKVADQDGEARRSLEQVERELKARQQLDEALERRADDPDGALRALEAVLDGTRAKERAAQEIKALRAALVSRWLRDGEKALAGGDWQAAKQFAEDILDLDKSNKDAPKLLEKARKAQRAAQTRPPAPTPRPTPTPAQPDQPSGGGKAAEAKRALDEGNKSILLGNFDEAVAKGKLALKLDAGLTDAHKLLGVAYARQGKYCDAKTHYKKFIELNPGSAMVDRIKQILQGEELKNCP